MGWPCPQIISDSGRDREADVAGDEALQLLVAEIVAVHDVDEAVEQPLGLEPLQPSGLRGAPPPWCIDAMRPNSWASWKSLSETSRVE